MTNSTGGQITAFEKILKITTLVTDNIAVAMAVFHLVVSVTGILPAMQQRSIHLAFAMILVLLQYATKNRGNEKAAGIGSIVRYVIMVALALCSVYVCYYIYMNWIGMSMRVPKPRQIELVMAAFIYFATLYITYLKLGWIMPAIALIFTFYAYLGAYMPMAIAHRGYTITRILSQSFMTTEGIYGMVLGVSATYIVLFVLFGALLEYSGAAKFFIDLSTALFGKTRGGSAKVATVGSGLFGMLTGSAVANVMAVGPLTIPMMVKAGYSKRFAGSVLSVAGTGGQFSPPVMGAAAFIIAETLGIPYINVALAAFIPAVLYYAAIWFTVDLRSEKEELKVLDDSEILNAWSVIKSGAYLAIPFVLLVVFLAVMRWSPIRSGFWSIAAVFVVSLFKKETRMTPSRTWHSLRKGAYGCVEVAAVCATAGIIVGMLSMTGLGLRFSTLLIAFSGGNKVLLLVMTALVGLVLGLGLTTTSVYIILSVVVAPALVKMDIAPLAAHLFVFYFGILSAITPPVALASYAAAGLAQDEPIPLSFTAWRLGLSGYILPFMFIYNQELLFLGSPLIILRAAITSFIGIYALSISLEGYYKKPLNIMLRVVMFGAALLLIDSGLWTDLVGLAIILAICGPRYVASRRNKAKPAVG